MSGDVTTDAAPVDESHAAGSHASPSTPPKPITDRKLRKICRKRIGGHRSEWTRSLGREGLRAGATLLLCLVVIVGGWIVVLLTWTRTEVAAATLPLGVLVVGGWMALTLAGLGSGLLLARRFPARWIVLAVALSGLVATLVAVQLWQRDVTIRLPAFWVIQLLSVALIGFILSGQFDKIWVRSFSLLGLAILAALLVTIGRNERVNIATREAENSYRQLEQITEDAGAESADLAAATALVARLCDLAGEPGCGDTTVAEGTGLGSCLSGWTYQAFEEWAEAASIDREVAGTAALARCVLEAFEPGSISEAGGDGGANEVGLTGDPQSPVDPENTDESTEAGDGSDAEAQAGARAEAQAAIDVRVAVAEAIATQRSEANLIESLSDGADGVLASVSGPNEFAEFRFSGATWLVLLALAFFWYRRLEIRAGSHGLGPVQIIYEDKPASGAADGESDGESGTSPADGQSTGLHAGQAVFKQAVVQNVPEPGAVPGAQALAPVGDLISSTDAPNKWVATGFVDAIRTILATRGGYTVLYSAHQEPNPSPDPRSGDQANETYVVFVRLRDTQSGTQQGSMRFESEYLAEAAQMAGYWVAGWIIYRSRYVPEWAVWSERDAHAFYSLQWRQGDDLPLQAHGVVDPDRIQASTNALILAQRAYAYQISPKLSNDGSDVEARRPYTLNALEDFARAAYHQPRYPVARYRRAVALSSLMHTDVELCKAFLPRPTTEPREDLQPSETQPIHRVRDFFGYGNGNDQPGDERAEEELLPSEPRLIHLFRDLIGYGKGNDQTGDGQAEKQPNRTGFLTHRFREFIAHRRGNDQTDEERAEQLRKWIGRARDDGVFPEDMRRAMLALSYAWLVESEHSVRTGLVARLRPSERRFWREFSRTGARRDWITLVRVSQEIVKLRLNAVGGIRLNGTRRMCTVGDKQFEAVCQIAHRPDSHWQISYNIGCYYALLAEQKHDEEEEDAAHDKDVERHAQLAFDWLERCLDRPFSGQLVREWVDRDPDLHALRDSDEFSEPWQRWRLRVPPMPVQIRQGDRSSAVKRLQRNLNRLAASATEQERTPDAKRKDRSDGASRFGRAVRAAGARWTRGGRPELVEDGYFGSKTRKAVEDFQYRHDLRVSGNPDLTMLALLETLAEGSERSTPPAA